MMGRGVPAANIPSVSGVRRIMALGDSQTLAAGLSKTGGYAYWINDFCRSRYLWWVGRQRHDVPEGWFPCEGYGGYSINNGGVGQLASIVDAAMMMLDPHVVVLMAGTNDLWYGPSVASAGAAHLEFLRQILTDKPTVKIIVCTIPVTAATGGTGFSEANVQALNALIAANVATIANANVVLCDLHAACAATPDFAATCLSAGDHLHLNDAGQQVWAAALQPVLATL